MNKILLSSNCVEVQCERGDTVPQQLLQDFYPVHSNRIGTKHRISLRKCPEVIEVLRKGEKLPEAAVRFITNELQARERLQGLMTGPKESPVVSPYLTLMRHQQLGREIAKVRDRYCFFFDTRTGKTPLSLAIIHDDIVANPTHKWLIVTPLTLIKDAWLPDAAKFLPDMHIVNCHAATKAKRLQAMSTAANVYITNVESFANYKEELTAMNFHGCIVDESSTMKSHKSQQSKALVDFSGTVKRWYLLSGRPSPNGDYEYYMQLKSVDFYAVPASYTQFKERYFINTSYNPQFENLILRPDKAQELKSVIAQYAIYVDMSDVLELAGRTFTTVELEMPKDLKKVYNDIKREMSAELKDVRITATNAGAMYNKLRQISSGFVIDTQAVRDNELYDESNKEVYLLDTYRFDALMKLLDSFDPQEQVVIWAQYHAEFDEIQRCLGQSCVILNGTVSLDKKSEAIERFKAGKVQYLVAHPQSAKFGLTLTNAHLCVYFSMSYSYEDWKQSVERIYGGTFSQPKHCYYYVLLTKGGIDIQIYNRVVNGKAIDSMLILDYLKSPDI